MKKCNDCGKTNCVLESQYDLIDEKIYYDLFIGKPWKGNCGEIY